MTVRNQQSIGSRVRRIKRSRRLMLASLAVLAAICTTTAIASRPHKLHATDIGSGSAPEAAANAETKQPEYSVVSTQSKKPQLTESVLLTITPRGFEPTEITVAQGPFFLLVENRSGIPEMSLRVNQSAGRLVKAADIGREEVDWADLLDLSPGTYVLSEAGHPGKVCTLTVNAN